MAAAVGAEAAEDLAALAEEAILAAAAPAAVGRLAMDQHLKGFVDDLRTTHGKNLVSIILYGSAAIGGHIEHAADYNILVTLEKIGPRDLRNSTAAVREWTRLGHTVPIYFTLEEVEDAVDVFPIEFHQMTRARKVLFGRDVLANVDVSNENLRHQVEFELRSKLLRLRRHYIPASTSVDGLTSLMADSLVSFIALFRGVLTLKGATPPVGRHGTLAMTVDVLGLEGKPLETIYNIRKNNLASPMDEVAANELFAQYLEQIERVIDAVDKMDQHS